MEKEMERERSGALSFILSAHTLLSLLSIYFYIKFTEDSSLLHITFTLTHSSTKDSVLFFLKPFLTLERTRTLSFIS
jgi:hypothetical protein